MLVNKVQPEFIGTNRIDPDYYRPEHLADEKHLRTFGSDELGVIGDFFAGPFGSKLPSNLWEECERAEHSIRMVTPHAKGGTKANLLMRSHSKGNFLWTSYVLWDAWPLFAPRLG